MTRDLLAGRINIVELNDYFPRPFVFTDIASSWRDVLRLSGVQSDHLVNLHDPNAYSIVLGAPKAIAKFIQDKDVNKIAIANFEQLGSASLLVTHDYLTWLKDKIVLDYHSSNIDYLIHVNGPSQRALELPLTPGVSMALTSDDLSHKTMDVLFFGTMNPRRNALIKQLQECNLKVECVSGAYGQELAPALARSRMVVHAHFYDTALFPIARMLRPIASAMPIVCENSIFSTHADWSQSGVLFARFEDLAAKCLDVINDPLHQLISIQKTLSFNASIDLKRPVQSIFDLFGAQRETS